MFSAFLLAGLPSAGAADTPKGNISRGRRAFFATCTNCHASTDSNRATGPSLHGILGRNAGTRAGYKYSEAMKDSGLVWTEALLDKYLAKPGAVFPGTPMTTGIFHAPMRDDIIAYLKTFGAKE
ncbi:c-type cytochrome [Termitidicoccus mucosus]|uniref:c-type cytochrome n=1 Tax=Termitidicoccus mucosus TaxID=1184151 RepID=UPI00269061AE